VWTRPAVGSLLSWRFPWEHGAVNDVGRLSPDLDLVSSLLSKRGYTCIALQANGNAGKRFGFGRGFQVFVDAEEINPTADLRQISSARVQKKLLDLADRLREPFFLFIQTIDPHDPYDPPPGYRRFVQFHPFNKLPRLRWLGDHAVATRVERKLANQSTQPEAAALAASYLEGLYDGNILHNDHWFGELVHWLKARGYFERTAVFLTADHGEAFREHGYDRWHAALYENTVRVPLILKPPHFTGRRLCREPVQHVDVVPTILEMVGSGDHGLPGRSLLASVRQAGTLLPRPLHIVRYRDLEIDRYRWEGRAVVSWPWKLIQDDLWRSRYELYDLARDPDEKHDLIQHPTEDDTVPLSFLRQEMRRHPMMLEEVYRRHSRLRAGDEEALKALGYVR
jgi:choline-sulfatase